MSANGPRRPVTARDFNRLLFALLLLGALTVLARLVTRQDIHASDVGTGQTLAQWVQTADALFVRGEYATAAEAYFGALETAAAEGARFDPRIEKKLALSLYEKGEERTAIHYMRLFRARLLRYERGQNLSELALDDPFQAKPAVTEERLIVDEQLASWGALD
jgi:hypothetical protein